MYSLEKFSIPSGGWGEIGFCQQVRLPRQENETRLSPKMETRLSKVLVAIRSHGRILTQVPGTLPDRYFSDVSLESAVEYLLADIGLEFDRSKSVLVGYFSQGYAGEKLLPKHHLVLVVDDALTVPKASGYRLEQPNSALASMESVIGQLILSLKPGDEVGWGNPVAGESPLMIWRNGRKLVRSTEEKLAA